MSKAHVRSASDPTLLLLIVDMPPSEHFKPRSWSVALFLVAGSSAAPFLFPRVKMGIFRASSSSRWMTEQRREYRWVAARPDRPSASLEQLRLRSEGLVVSQDREINCVGAERSSTAASPLRPPFHVYCAETSNARIPRAVKQRADEDMLSRVISSSPTARDSGAKVQPKFSQRIRADVRTTISSPGSKTTTGQLTQEAKRVHSSWGHAGDVFCSNRPQTARSRWRWNCSSGIESCLCWT